MSVSWYCHNETRQCVAFFFLFFTFQPPWLATLLSWVARWIPHTQWILVARQSRRTHQRDWTSPGNNNITPAVNAKGTCRSKFLGTFSCHHRVWLYHKLKKKLVLNIFRWVGQQQKMNTWKFSTVNSKCKIKPWLACGGSIVRDKCTAWLSLRMNERLQCYEVHFLPIWYYDHIVLICHQKQWIVPQGIYDYM